MGDDRLTATICTPQGHRFRRADPLLPMLGTRTGLGFEGCGALGDDGRQARLTARACGKRFAGASARTGNLIAGPPGAPPRRQPQPRRYARPGPDRGDRHGRGSRDRRRGRRVIATFFTD